MPSKILSRRSFYYIWFVLCIPIILTLLFSVYFLDNSFFKICSYSGVWFTEADCPSGLLIYELIISGLLNFIGIIAVPIIYALLWIYALISFKKRAVGIENDISIHPERNKKLKQYKLYKAILFGMPLIILGIFFVGDTIIMFFSHIKNEQREEQLLTWSREEAIFVSKATENLPERCQASNDFFITECEKKTYPQMSCLHIPSNTIPENNLGYIFISHENIWDGGIPLVITSAKKYEKVLTINDAYPFTAPDFTQEAIITLPQLSALFVPLNQYQYQPGSTYDIRISLFNKDDIVPAISKDKFIELLVKQRITPEGTWSKTFNSYEPSYNLPWNNQPVTYANIFPDRTNCLTVSVKKP